MSFSKQYLCQTTFTIGCNYFICSENATGSKQKLFILPDTWPLLLRTASPRVCLWQLEALSTALALGRSDGKLGIITLCKSLELF